MKVMSARGWRRVEPGDDRLGALESPVQLNRAVRTLEQAGLGVDRLCDEAAPPVDEVRPLLAVTTDQPAIEI